MKLPKVIEICNLENEANYFEYKYNENPEEKANTLTVKNQAIYYWCETEISSFEIFDDKQLKYQTSKNIEKYLKGNNEIKNIYYVVYSLLNQIGEYKRIENKCFKVNDYIESRINNCVELVVSEIVDKLDFSQISTMKTLISIINRNKYYQQLMFRVEEYTYNINTKGYRNPNVNKYNFGNVEYHEQLNIVQITAHNDFVKLIDCKKGKIYKDKLDDNSNIEGKIIKALYIWDNYMKN